MNAGNAELNPAGTGSAVILPLPGSEGAGNRAGSDHSGDLPAHTPLGEGLEGRDFDRHYRDCLQEKKQQILQNIFTGWHFWLEPLGLGFFPGKLFADLFLSADVGLPTIIFLGGSSCLLIGPWMIRHRQRHNQHKRFHVFYMAALERCIKPG